MFDLLVSITMAFLPPCGPAATDVFGCTQHYVVAESSLVRANFQVGATGHYIEVIDGIEITHQTYPLLIDSSVEAGS